MLSTVVPLQLTLGGEEFPAEPTGGGALCLLEVLSADMVLQGSWDAERG